MYFSFSKQDSIKEITTEEKLNYKWNFPIIEGKESFCLGEFKKVNFFIGSNNSGKSRFLRAIIKSDFRKEELQISKNLSPVNIKLNLLIRDISDFKSKYEFFLEGEIKHLNKLLNNNIYLRTISGNISYSDEIKALDGLISRAKDQLENRGFRKVNFIELINRAKIILDELLWIGKLLPSKKTYIPILRSIHEESGSLDLGNFKEVVKSKYGIENDVFTGLELYRTISTLKNSSGNNRKKVREFESFLSKYFFKGKLVELTSDKKKQEMLFSVDDEEYPIYHLGDGIQSLIILLFPIFIADNNDWFFIEEPEMNLHPGLQRVFIETLLNDEYLKSKNLKYFFTTHSNHFLDTSIQSDDISIFQFEKQEDNTFFIKTNVKPKKEVLDILGVNTSSVFLANTSLWVEGPTDRKYLSKFLKLFCNHKELQPLKEDIDFAFFEYGGNLIAHYLFDDEEEFDDEEVRNKINSFALSNKIFLLADNDNAIKGSKKDSRRIALNKLSEENDNFTYQNTELKEIENLLPKKIIQDFISQILKTEKSISISNKIVFSRNDYKNIGLGRFYYDLFVNNKIPKIDIKPFKAESGTLKNDYKIKLASFVVDSEYTYSDLIEDNEELKNIIENLYKFITN